MPTVALIDYGSGNLASAAKALARAANGKFEIVTTADPEVVKDAERVVLPGVGAFADCMRGLSAVPGMVEALREKVLKEGAPFLGICEVGSGFRLFQHSISSRQHYYEALGKGYI